MMSPITHTPSSTSDGFDQAGSLNQSGPWMPNERQDQVDRAGARVEQEDEGDGGSHGRDERREGRTACARGRMPAWPGRACRRPPARVTIRTGTRITTNQSVLRADCHDLRVLGEQELVVARARSTPAGETRSYRVNE